MNEIKINNNYEFDIKDVEEVGLLGYERCPVCNKISLKGVAFNKANDEKYLHCYNCELMIPIQQETFETMSSFVKVVPQDINLLEQIWNFSLEWYTENIGKYLSKDKDVQNVADEVGEIVFNKVLSKFGDLNNKFVSNTVNSAFDLYMDTWIEHSKKNMEEDEKKTKKNASGEKKELQKIILEDYLQANLKIMSENVDFFAYPTKYNCIVSRNGNSALFDDLYDGNKYINLPDQLVSYKLVHSLCMLYQFILQYKENHPEYDRYFILKKYKINYSITTSEVHVLSAKGLGLLGHDEGMYAKISIESFESAINLFLNLETLLEGNKKISYGKIIKDFVDNKYYMLGIDIAMAIFVFKNSDYFKDYVNMNEDIREFIKIINSSKSIVDFINQLAKEYC